MKIMIAPTTSSASKLLKIPAGAVLTVSASKLAGAETVSFQLAEDGVASPGQLFQDGNVRQLTASHNAMTIAGPVDLTATKSATAQAVGVYSKE